MLSAAFSPLTLLVGHQEEHPTCKNCVDVIICLEWGADCLHMVQLMPLPSQTPSSVTPFKSRLLAYPGCPGKEANGCSSVFSVIALVVR